MARAGLGLLHAAMLVAAAPGVAGREAPRHLRGLEGTADEERRMGTLRLTANFSNPADLYNRIQFSKVNTALKTYLGCEGVSVHSMRQPPSDSRGTKEFEMTFEARGVVRSSEVPLIQSLSGSLDVDVTNASLTWVEPESPEVPGDPPAEAPAARADGGSEEESQMIIVPGVLVSILLIVPALLMVCAWSLVRRRRHAKERMSFKEAAEMEVAATAAEYHEQTANRQAQAGLPNPNTRVIYFDDPREKRLQVGIVGFSLTNTPEEFNALFGSAFLGTFFDLGPDGILIEGRYPNTMTFESKTFTNAEAAFHALKVWNQADRFKYLGGEKAIQLHRQLRGEEDLKYAGHSSAWLAMLAVLRAKFSQNDNCAAALLKTGDTYLLAHSHHEGVDNLWSNNKAGTGRNWLGLQLMLIRDELQCESGGTATWAHYIQDFCGIDLVTGTSHHNSGNQAWQSTVHGATQALTWKLTGQAEEKPVVVGKALPRTQAGRCERSPGASPLDLDISFDES